MIKFSRSSRKIPGLLTTAPCRFYAQWTPDYFQTTKPCQVILESGGNSLLVTAPEEEWFQKLIKHASPCFGEPEMNFAWRSFRIMYDPVTFEVTWTSIPWEKEDQFPGQTIGGSPDVNFLSRSGRNNRNGDVWWVFDTISTRQGCRVVLPCYWRVRGGEKGVDLLRASDGSKVGRLKVNARHLPGPSGKTFVDVSARVDQHDGDVVVQYLTGGNGRSTEIIIPLPSGGNHSFVWGNGEDDRSRMHGGAESLPKRWFYCIGRKLGKGRKFGSSGSEVWGQPAAGHGMSDFGSSSWRVVSKETYARLLVAIPVADQAEIAA